MTHTLQHNIMRRVYYSFALRFIADPMLWQGFVLGACIALFGRLTHVASIASNFSQTRFDQAPHFVWNSFVHAYQSGEVLTVLVALFMIGLTLSFFYRAIPLLLMRPQLQVA